MKDTTLRNAIQALQDSRNCGTCPLDVILCRQISNALFKEERCLIVVSINEILAFHTEEHKKAHKEFMKKPEKD